MPDLSAIVTDSITPVSAAGDGEGRRVEHFAWIDLRGVADDLRDALLQAAIHHRIDGIVSDDLVLLSDLPPTIRRILAVTTDHQPDELTDLTVDIVLTHNTDANPPQGKAQQGTEIVVSDAPTLQSACDAVRVTPWTVLTFTDPTKIPLEIVIAAAENSGGHTVTVVNDITDAEIVKLVLEHGSDGLLLTPTSADDVATLAHLVSHRHHNIALAELTVTGIEHIGMGDRACIDTCSLLETDEGCLIGSFASGMFLSCSETHPLPYMPTRPFRWNAGAVHSYVLMPDNRTRYVSELRAGQPILAIRSDGTAREVRIGRIKIERRPLLSITATTPDGATINVITQDDWHVRLLGPGGTVNNVTELKTGDHLLGYIPTESRHVGLSFVLCCFTFARRDQLIKAAESALAQTAPGERVIVVVDHNDELQADLAAVFGDRVILTNNIFEQGVSGARNTGTQLADQDVVVFIDDDAALQPGALAAVRAAFADESVISIGGAINGDWEIGAAPHWFPAEFGWVVGCDYRGLPDHGGALRNPIGAAMAVRREALHQINGFSSHLGRFGSFPTGCEETHMGVRLQREFPDHRIVRNTGFRVSHYVPANRATVKYFARRCFQEGRSKAILTRMAGQRDALSSERSYTTKILTSGLWQARRNPARAAALVGGFALTCAGFALGLLQASLLGRTRVVAVGTERQDQVR